MASVGGTGDASNRNNANGNGVVLYHFQRSYYSQQVVIALLEKKLKFRSHIIQLPKFEQYGPSFMRLNPKGEVPVLTDGVKVIPDSARIIDYLEDNFSNGDTPRLLPLKGSEESQKVKHFRELLNNIDIENLTMGAITYPEFTKDLKLPNFIIKRMKGLRSQRLQVLEDNSKKFPDLKEHYERKLHLSKTRILEQEKKETLVQNLQQLDDILNEVEDELATHAQEDTNYWLCCKQFTVADISLVVLLHRSNLLGLSHRFWGKNRRPHVATYFERMQQLESYRTACLTVPTYEKVLYTVEMIKHKAPFIIGAAVLLAAIAAGVVYYRKFK